MLFKSRHLPIFKQVNQKVKQRDHIISTACRHKFKLMDTWKYNVAQECVNTLFSDVVFAFGVNVCRSVAEVNEIHIMSVKYIIIAHVIVVFINVIVKEEVV